MGKKQLFFYFCIISFGLICYFVANFERIAIPGAIFDTLQYELKIATPYITALGATFMYVYAMAQLIMGVLVDKYGGKRIMLSGGIIFAIGCILFPITSYLPLMYLSRALLGLGSSAFYLSLINELGLIFNDKNYGIAISVMLFVGYAGGIFANAPFVMLMKYMSWRDILFVISVIVIIALIIYILILSKVELPPQKEHVKIRTLPFRLVLHKRHNRNLFSFACCNFGISYVIQTIIGKKFLEDFCLYSSKKAALVLSIMAIVAACANIVNAYICRMCHNHRVAFLKHAAKITFISLLAICILIFFDAKTIFIPIIFCILAGNASLTSLLVPVLHLTNNKMTSNTAIGIMNFCFFMMVGILGTITGVILDVFEPRKINNTLVYNNNSYLLLFGTFLLISMFELYKAMKLSEKY